MSDREKKAPLGEALADNRLCDPNDDPKNPDSYKTLTPADVCGMRPWADQVKNLAWRRQVAPLPALMAYLVRCAATLPPRLVRLSVQIDPDYWTSMNMFLLIDGPPGTGKTAAVDLIRDHCVLPVVLRPDLVDPEGDAWDPGEASGGWWGLCQGEAIDPTTGAGLLESYVERLASKRGPGKAVQRLWARWGYTDEAARLTSRSTRDHPLFTDARQIWGRGSAAHDNATVGHRRSIWNVGLGWIISGQPTPNSSGVILDDTHTAQHGTLERFMVAAAMDPTRPGWKEAAAMPSVSGVRFRPSLSRGLTTIRAEQEVVEHIAEMRDRLTRRGERPNWYQLVSHGEHTMLMAARLAAVIGLNDRPDEQPTVTRADMNYALVLLRASRVARTEAMINIRTGKGQELVDRAKSDGKARVIRDTLIADRHEQKLETLKKVYENRLWEWIKTNPGRKRGDVQRYGYKPSVEQRRIEGMETSRLKGLTVDALVHAGRVKLEDDSTLTAIETEKERD